MMQCSPHSEMKLKIQSKQNAKTAVKRFSCFNRSRPVSTVYNCCLGAYDAANQTLVNQNGDHIRH